MASGFDCEDSRTADLRGVFEYLLWFPFRLGWGFFAGTCYREFRGGCVSWGARSKSRAAVSVGVIAVRYPKP